MATIEDYLQLDGFVNHPRNRIGRVQNNNVLHTLLRSQLLAFANSGHPYIVGAYNAKDEWLRIRVAVHEDKISDEETVRIAEAEQLREDLKLQEKEDYERRPWPTPSPTALPHKERLQKAKAKQDATKIPIDDWTSSVPVRRYESFTLEECISDRFLSFAKQAPYGDLHTEQTVINTDVRDAWEIAAGEWEFVCQYRGQYSFPSRNALKNIISDEISRQLAFGARVKLVPYKINIYKPGGHFAGHVDTPSDAKMLGTLILALPTGYEGGELKIQDEVLELSSVTHITWVAFYGDVLHEVLPVTNGRRITLTYHILWDVADFDPVSIAKEPERTAKRQKLEQVQGSHINIGSWKDIKHDHKKLDIAPNRSVEHLNAHLRQIETSIAAVAADARSKHVGMFLTYGYPSTGLFPDVLKGTDALLFKAMQERFDNVFLATAIRKRYTEEGYEGSREGLEKPGNDVYCLCPGCLHESDDGAKKEVHALHNKTPFILTFDDGLKLKHDLQSAGYMGNEGQNGHDHRVYYQSAMIVDVSSTRQDKHLQLTQEHAKWLEEKEQEKLVNYSDDSEEASLSDNSSGCGEMEESASSQTLDEVEG